MDATAAGPDSSCGGCVNGKVIEMTDTCYLVGKHIELYPIKDDCLSAFNRTTRKTYAFGKKESAVLRRLDGTHTLEEIREACPFYSAEELQLLMDAFGRIGLFRPEKTKLSILRMRFRLLNPNAFLKSGSRTTNILFYLLVWGAPLTFLIGVACNLLAGANTGAAPAAAEALLQSIYDLSPWGWVAVAVASDLCLALHEAAHAVAARYYDTNVPEIGVMLYFFMPFAYTNVSGLNLLTKKKEKLVILFAGTLANLGVIGLIYMLIPLVGAPSVRAVLYMIIIANLITVVTNGMVFLKFDGYYILEVLFDAPGFKDQATTYLRLLLSAALTRDKELKARLRGQIQALELNDTAKAVYIAYNLLSALVIPAFVFSSVTSLFHS